MNRRRGIVWAGVAAFVAVAVAAVGVPNATANDVTKPDTVGALPSTALAPATPKLTVLDPGSAPRRPLRLELAVGVAPPTTMTMSFATQQKIGSQAAQTATIPPVRMTAATNVIRVAANGGGEYETRYTDIVVDDDGSLSADQLAQLDAQFDAMENLVVRVEVDGRNQVVRQSVDGADQLPASVAALTEQIADQTSSLNVPFPEEAVGVGARWRMTSQVQVSGIEVENTITIRLKEIDGDHVELGSSIRQTAEPQRMDPSTLPEGTTARLLSLRGTGTGTTTLSTAVPMPVAATSKASTRQRLKIRAQGQSAVITQQVDIELELAAA